MGVFSEVAKAQMAERAVRALVDHDLAIRFPDLHRMTRLAWLMSTSARSAIVAVDR